MSYRIDEQPVIRRMQELDAVIHQNRVIFDWDPQFCASPLGDRRVGKELEREHVLRVQRERTSAAAATSSATARCRDRYCPPDESRRRRPSCHPCSARLNSMTPNPAALQRLVHLFHRLVGAHARFNRALEHVAHGERLVERILNACGRRRFTGLEHVGDTFDVGPEVHQLDAPVDHDHVAGLDDARGGRGGDALRDP